MSTEDRSPKALKSHSRVGCADPGDLINHLPSRPSSGRSAVPPNDVCLKFESRKTHQCSEAREPNKNIPSQAPCALYSSPTLHPVQA